MSDRVTEPSQRADHGDACTIRKGPSVSNDASDLPEGFDHAASKGLGMTLVSSFAAQIGGELRIDRGDDNDCTRFTVPFN